MKKQYVGPVFLMTLLFHVTSCSGPAGSGLSSGSLMSGVAATGAPISGGLVKIKGSNGQVVEETTASDGTYAANISSLQEPYLVQVIAPSGEKYISVASQSALAAGKKINVTPLTHTIVANVFGKADGDEIFANFEAESSNFSEAKLETEKEELVQKFIDAGLLGSGKVASADLDLLNGDFVAGSGQGVDGLMDVITVNTDSAAGIEITLKGESSAIITDKVDGSTDPVVTTINPTQLSQAKEQLSVLDQIRARMNALAALHSSKVACNGTPVDSGDNSSACDIDNLHDAFAPFFHPDYQEDGNTIEAGIWGWFCRTSNEDDTESRSECLASGSIAFEDVSLKDITLINYDNVNKVALVSFNFYEAGVLKGSEDMTLKYDSVGLTYDLIGNKKTFEYWIETEAIHNTEYNKISNTSADSYSVNLNFYMDDVKNYTFLGNETLTLTAASGHQIFPGDSATLPIYMVKGPRHDNNNQCTLGATFSATQTPYKVFNSSTGVATYADYATACPNNENPCNNSCSGGYYDYDKAQKVSLTAGQIALMNKVELITMTGSPLPSGGDSFTIKKPLMVNAFNASTYIPSFGMSASNFCENVTFETALNLSVNTGTLSHISLHHSYSDASNQWTNESKQDDFWDLNTTSAVFSPSFSAIGNETIHYSHLYLSSRDEFDRQFVRRVNCSEQQL